MCSSTGKCIANDKGAFSIYVRYSEKDGIIRIEQIYDCYNFRVRLIDNNLSASM